MSVENPVIKGTKCICGYGMDTLTAENGRSTKWCSICNRVKPTNELVLTVRNYENDKREYQLKKWE